MSVQITDTERQVRAIVARKLDMDTDQVPLGESLLEGLGLDSFSIMTLVLEIEESFPSINLSDQAILELPTLRDLAAYIDRELGDT